MIERRYTASRPVAVGQTFAVLRNGAYDPCVRLEAGRLWRATRTPAGAATMVLDADENAVRLRAWGAGAGWCADHLEEFVGEHCEDLPLVDESIGAIARAFPGLRIPRTLALVELAIPMILGQRVTTGEAFRSYRQIVRAVSGPAPGPGNLLLPPDPEELGRYPSWWFHRFGVERKRAQAIIAVCNRATAIDRLVDLPSSEARSQLLTVPGLGLWTAGIIGLYGLGDHDSVVIGDFHFPNHVAWALAGEARGDDRRMLELLDAHRPQRGRVQRLVLLGSSSAPKFGPRYNPLPLAEI